MGRGRWIQPHAAPTGCKSHRPDSGGGCVPCFHRDRTPPLFCRTPQSSWQCMKITPRKTAERHHKDVSCYMFLSVRERTSNKSSCQQCKKKYLCYYEYIVKSQSSYTHFSISYTYINKVSSIVIGMRDRNKHTDFNVKLTNSWTSSPSFVASLGLSMLTVKSSRKKVTQAVMLMISPGISLIPFTVSFPLPFLV